MKGPKNNLTWEIKQFDLLSASEFHDIIQLRVNVFVVEQACAYAEIDGKDPECLHATGRSKDGQLLAVSRIGPPGVIYSYASIGRVVTARESRGLGYGKDLMRNCIDFCFRTYPESSIKIAAQKYLEPFYLEFGFETVSDEYPWDGIDHVDMILANRSSN